MATLCEVVYLIALEDFPARWDIAGQIAHTLATSNDLAEIYAWLLALKAIFSVYKENFEGEKRGELVDLIVTVFPAMLHLVSNAARCYNEVTEAVLLAVVKVFGKGTYIDLVENLKVSASMHHWLVFLKRTLDAQEGSRTPAFFSMKKTILKIILRFVQKHANPKYDRPFSQLFCQKYAKPFLESALKAFLTTTDAEVYNAALANLPYFYAHFENCRDILERSRDKLFAMAVGRCALTSEDIALWGDDPVEFIHRERDNRKLVVEFVRGYHNSGLIVGG